MQGAAAHSVRRFTPDGGDAAVQGAAASAGRTACRSNAAMVGICILDEVPPRCARPGVCRACTTGRADRHTCPQERGRGLAQTALTRRTRPADLAAANGSQGTARGVLPPQGRGCRAAQGARRAWQGELVSRLALAFQSALLPGSNVACKTTARAI